MRHFGGWDKLQLLFPTALPQPGTPPSFQPSNSQQPSLFAWQYCLLLLSYPYYCSGQQKLLNWIWCSSLNSCTPFSSLAVGTGFPSKSAFLGQCFTDVNSKIEASSAQYGGRLKVVKCRESRPFPIKQTAEMFPCIRFLAINSAWEQCPNFLSFSWNNNISNWINVSSFR